MNDTRMTALVALPPEARRPRCAACSTGPSGIMGHDQLRVKAMGSGVMRLACGACAQDWLRKGFILGRFTWEATEGVQLADRSHSPGVPLPAR